MRTLSPEMRRFVEAVREVAEAPFDSPKTWDLLTVAADALLSADATHTEKVAAALADVNAEHAGNLARLANAGEVGKPCTHDYWNEPCPRCDYSKQPPRGPRDEQPAPAPARRDEELVRLLAEHGQASRAWDGLGAAQKLDAIVAHVARRVAEAEGVTVGFCYVRRGASDSAFVSAHSFALNEGTLSDLDRGNAIRVRLVRAAQPGEVGK